jgi:hypothetical protein
MSTKDQLNRTDNMEGESRHGCDDPNFDWHQEV